MGLAGWRCFFKRGGVDASTGDLCNPARPTLLDGQRQIGTTGPRTVVRRKERVLGGRVWWSGIIFLVVESVSGTIWIGVFRMEQLRDFDADFYAAWYQLPNGEELAVEDYLKNSDGDGTEKRYPNFQAFVSAEFPDAASVPLDFDWEYYVKANESVPSDLDRWQAMLHYALIGQEEGLPFREESVGEDQSSVTAFNDSWYANTYSVKLEEALDHYKNLGIPNKLAPNRFFSTLDYMESAADVAVAWRDPFEHFVTRGRFEGRGASPVDSKYESSRRVFYPSAIGAAKLFFAFDETHYARIRPDVVRSGQRLDQLNGHYRDFGEQEGSRPNPYFDPSFYKRRYAKHLEHWKRTALEHFLEVGLLRGFSPSNEISQAIQRLNLSGAVEWVGYWKGVKGMQPLANHDLNSAAELSIKQSGKQGTPQSAGPRPDVKVSKKTLNWVIPPFVKGGGGHTTIFRAARTFARLGWKSVFWITGSLGPSHIDSQRNEFIGYFPQSPVEFRSVKDGFHEVEGEILIATAWETAYIVNENLKDNARLYFVQDKESLFEAAGTRSLLADYTYRLPFNYICAGEWLEEMVKPFDRKSTHFELCATPTYSRFDPPVEDRDVLAAIYIRSNSPRRASDLMIDSANQLAEKGLGRVVVFGDGYEGHPLNPAVENMGVLTTDEMADLFQHTKFGFAASASNYSILPGELASAGTVVIQPASDTIGATTVAHGGYEVAPTPEAMVATVEEYLDGLDQSKFDELRKPYMDFARSISWEKEFEKVAEWMTETVLSSEEPIVETPRKSVGVVIPTYYPNEQFLQIVQAVQNQLTSFDVTLQIVDTRVDGRKSPVIDEIEESGFANVEAIDSADFSHGPTRTLGARLLDSDYYAFLTDDALPADEYWLESLVTPLVIVPNCAYSYGRHKAYPHHRDAYAKELKFHFDNLQGQGFVFNRMMIGDQFDSDPYLVAGLSFNSDNSAAYPGPLLRERGFPPIDFGEDQAWAAQMLREGYSRAFANTSIVYHSHDFEDQLDKAFDRGVEEGRALYRNFGIIRYHDEHEVKAAKRGTSELWGLWAVEIGMTEAQFNSLLAAKYAFIDGTWDECVRLLKED